jgi:hypothetical protein
MNLRYAAALVPRSKLFSALLLIASVLFLSAANEVPKPSPSPRAITHNDEAAQTGKSKADHNAVSLEASQPRPGSEAGQSQHKPIEILIDKDWSDYGLLYAALLVALIAFFQYRVSNLTYLVDRPYLIVGAITLHNMTTVVRAGGIAFMTATVMIENVGKRPAVIKEAKGELILLPDASKGGWPTAPSDWGTLKNLLFASLEKKVVGGNAAIELLIKYKANLLSEDDYKAIKMSYEKILVAVGSIRYKAVAGWWHRYKTTFGMKYSPAGLIGEKEFFMTGPSKYNRNT